MGRNSAIEWTNSTWNPWRGCIKVSPGCKNCYMYRDQIRYGRDPKQVVRAANATFEKPLSWPPGELIFTCSWSDWFIPAADPWRDDAWEIIRQCRNKIFQILTKRPELIADHLPIDWGRGWDNVWLGVSVESPEYLPRIDKLFEIPAVIRFVSYEPALAGVDFSAHMAKGAIDWLISGGESGDGRRFIPRPADLDWFRKARDDCRRFSIPFFHKQNGGTKKIDGAWGGCLLDGHRYTQFPGLSDQSWDRLFA